MGEEAPGMGAEPATTEETHGSPPWPASTRPDLFLVDFMDADKPFEDTWQITSARARVWAAGAHRPVETISGSPLCMATGQLLSPDETRSNRLLRLDVSMSERANIDSEDVLIVLAHIFPCRMLSSGHEARMS